MKRNPWLMLLIVVLMFVSVIAFVMSSAVNSIFGPSSSKIASKDSILFLRLDGIILDSRKFLKPLIKYRDQDSIRAVVLEINSPGGVVGPSQQIYSELKKIREVYKKPLIVVSNSLIASGGYYSALAADRIFVAPGTLIGSIGVVMEFVNLEGLYSWAKVQRYSITTGKFKDSGAEYRSMREDEKTLFQELANNVLSQFKKAVVDGRKLDAQQVDQLADGRVFTGEQAVKLGLADGFATVDEAISFAAEQAGLQEGKYKIFEPPKERKDIFDRLFREEEEEFYSTQLGPALEKLLKTQLLNQPLYLMPGSWL